MMSLLTVPTTTLLPAAFLAEQGHIFTRFDQQDSGNVSYGLAAGSHRYFVKTAGPPEAPVFMAHEERVAWLRKAIRLNQAFVDPALPRLRHVVEGPQGPLLIYDWVTGDLLRPGPAHDRFKALPLTDLLPALDVVFQVHRRLADAGWVASDFYDGALMYDFGARRLYLVDLDHYHPGPFVNEMGRLFGSSRFMAPEEFVRGALIDERTTVFNLGRCLAIFLADHLAAARSLEPALMRLTAQACAAQPADRFPTVAAFYDAWVAARAACEGQVT